MTYNIVVYGTLPNLQTASASFQLIGYSYPVFSSSISNVVLSVGQTQTVVLPSYSDPNNLPVTMSNPVLQGTAGLPSFVTYATPPNIVITPTAFS